MSGTSFGLLESCRNVSVTCWQMLNIRDKSISTLIISSPPVSLSVPVAAFVWRFQVITDKDLFHIVNQIVLAICSPATCIVWHGVFLWDIHLRSDPPQLSPPLDWWEVAGSCGCVTAKSLTACWYQQAQKTSRCLTRHHYPAVRSHFPEKVKPASPSFTRSHDGIWWWNAQKYIMLLTECLNNSKKAPSWKQENSFVFVAEKASITQGCSKKGSFRAPFLRRACSH